MPTTYFLRDRVLVQRESATGKAARERRCPWDDFKVIVARIDFQEGAEFYAAALVHGISPDSATVALAFLVHRKVIDPISNGRHRITSGNVLEDAVVGFWSLDAADRG